MSPPLDPKASSGVLLWALACSSTSPADVERGEAPNTTAAPEPSANSTSGPSGSGPATASPSSPAASPSSPAASPSSPTPSPSPSPSAGVGTTPTEPNVTAPSPMEIIEIVPDPPPLLSTCEATSVEGSAEARAHLSSFAVRHGDFVRRTLYSWTPPEQIDELRADPTLLTRSMTSGGERGRASDVILEHAASDPLAELLARPEFEKKRFAWSNPWATLLGWTGEDYGDRLLGITLREDAWVGRLLVDLSGSLQWSFADMQGAEVTHEDVLAHPERLAAVYFVDARDPALCGGSLLHAGSVLREYFLCNEAMIERWEAFTPALAEELERGVSALTELRDALLSSGCDSLTDPAECWRERVVFSWKLGPQGSEIPDVALNEGGWRRFDPEVQRETLDHLVPLYEASLAFPNDLYLPIVRNLNHLLERLREVPLDFEPLEHEVALEGDASLRQSSNLR